MIKVVILLLMALRKLLLLRRDRLVISYLFSILNCKHQNTHGMPKLDLRERKVTSLLSSSN